GGSGGASSDGGLQTDGATSTGGATGTGGTTSTGGAQSTGGTTGTGGAACSDFTEKPTTSPTRIRVVNNTNANLYLGSPTPTCVLDVGYTLEDSLGHPLLPTIDPCQFTCADLQTGGCGCPPVACYPNIVTLVAPGKSLDYGWPGTVFTPKSMPASCLQ